MEPTTPHYKHNDIIWGKVTGHPWWPGIINELDYSSHSNIYRVDFFGYPPSHSLLPVTKIIKYEDYSKIIGMQNAGRTSPGLKKAISEASILYNTLQQSKASPINKPASQICFYENDNTAFSVNKTEQRMVLEQKKINKLMECPLIFSQNELEDPVRIKHKIIRKRRDSLKIVRQKLQKKQLQRKNVEIIELLKKYKLEVIPQIQKTKQQKKWTEHNTRNLVRMLYRHCRRFYSREQSIANAIEYAKNITNNSELKQFINKNQSNLPYNKLQTSILQEEKKAWV